MHGSGSGFKMANMEREVLNIARFSQNQGGVECARRTLLRSFWREALAEPSF